MKGRAMGVPGQNLAIPIVGGAPEIDDLHVRDMPLKIGSVHDRKVIGAKGRDIRVEILECVPPAAHVMFDGELPVPGYDPHDDLTHFRPALGDERFGDIGKRLTLLALHFVLNEFDESLTLLRSAMKPHNRVRLDFKRPRGRDE